MNRKKTVLAVPNTSICWSDDAWDDYLHWQQFDPEILNKINRLIEECLRTPFTGTGKPEPLKGDLSGFWSRRITHADRLVYQVEGGCLTIVQCRYHY